ncbi:hypothetical protein J2X36_002936 [Methylobacterium sp. BE186]|uniref:DUF4164 family protein n=1 Tax=Methylobacterium sp. BE186 TaxID=2817715 RepID=UPI00285A0668|nr:DUF4164 family protein [Methylobacterium sp. BE186]MDR7038180.1 hypothetical protein [Methylobacterium sp. BE186]
MTASIDDALLRLDAALNRLETTVARRLEAARDPDEREVELAIMGEDRARLAAALDAAQARLAEVTATADAIGGRLDRAIDTVEGVLAERDGEGRPPA